MLAALALPAHGQQAPVSPQTLPVKHKLTAAPKVIISTIPDVIRTPEGQRHDNCIRAAHGFYDSYYDLNEYDNTEAVQRRHAGGTPATNRGGRKLRQQFCGKDEAERPGQLDA